MPTLEENVNRVKAAKTAIGNAITAKGGTVGANDGLEDFAADIATIPSGGGGSQPRKDVNFYDYDGTIVNSYTATEFANLSAMPSNPSHTGLTAQGWNWSLANAKTYVADYGALDIGQMYASNTTDGKTYLHIRLGEGRLKPYLGLTGNSNGTAVTIDWGDGSATESVTLNTSTVYTPHEYASDGKYDISIDVTNGTVSLNSASNSTNLFRKSISADANNDKVYANVLIKAEIGSRVTSIGGNAFNSCTSLTSITLPNTITSIGDSAFQSCYSLTSVTIPSGVTSIRTSAFTNCYSLTSVTIPDTVTSIGGNAFQSCTSLTSITIPNTVTSIGTYAFYNCYSLTSITLPNTITSIGDSAFYSCTSLTSITIPNTITSIGTYALYSCTSLTSITIPNTVTSIGTYAFNSCFSLTSITLPNTITSIGTSAFTNCFSLTSITIPNTVTSIGNSAFNGARGLGFIKFESANPPSVSATTAWSNVPTDCIIYVPTGTIETYKATQNYPNPSTYTYVEY